MNYDLKYWKDYNSVTRVNYSSDFARFCNNRMKGSVLDVCCGNCRDSDWFTLSREVKAFDIVERDKPYDYRVVNLLDRSDGFTFDSVDNVYCRFTLHAVPEYIEDYILIESYHLLPVGGLLFIEARSDKGTHNGTHYRRLINYDTLISKLKNIGFEINFSCEHDGLSVDYDDPVLIRVVAEKKSPINIESTISWDDFHDLTPLDPVSARHLLLSAKTVLTDVLFYLSFGTLLGAYRNNDFIEYDTDIDLVLLDSQIADIDRLINKGYFALYGLELIRKLDALYTFRYKDNYIDLYFFTRKADKYWCWRSYSIHHYLIDNKPTIINFVGNDFQTFSNIEKYLIHQYGDWQTPVNYELKK